MDKQLKNVLGLTDNEARIYIGLLKTGQKTAAYLARELGMDKSSCYRAVDNLVKKNLLIPNIKVRGTTYSAADPSVIKNIFEDRKNLFSAQEKMIDVFINKLSKNIEQKRDTFIKVESGIQALRNAMNKTLEDAINGNMTIKERYRLDSPYFRDKDHVNWVMDFTKRRIKAGVSIKQIVNFAGQDVFAPIMKTSKALLKEIRLMPDKMKDTNGFRVTDNLVYITSIDKNGGFIVITIKDKYVANMFNAMFDFVWENSKKY